MGEKKLNWGIILSIALVGFSMSTGWALNKGLTFKLLEVKYTNAPTVIGAILSLQGLMGLIVPPILGYYSDVYRSRWGRRVPFIFAGSMLVAITTALIYFSYIKGVSLTVFAVLLALYYLFMYSFVAQYRSLMPDVVESGERGKASGVITLFEWMANLVLFGTIAFLAASATKQTGINEGIKAMIQAGNFWIPFAIVIFFMVVSGTYVLLRVREPPVPEETPEEGLTEYLKNIITDRDFLSFYIAQMLWWLSFEFVAVFLFGILESVLGTKDVTALGNAIMALFNLTVLVGAIVGGPLYDKIGRRKSILISGFIFMIPFLFGWFVSTKTEIASLIGVAGIGWGMLMATSWPVIGDLLTKYQKEAFNGRYYGVFEATKSFPILIAGLVGGAIVHLAGDNYKILFPVGAIFVIISLPLIWGMKHLDVGAPVEEEDTEVQA
jgi:maltose/moltooligosaccharide transporter